MTEDTKTKPQQEEQDEKQSKWPLLISGLLIAALVASYFIFPEFKSTMQEGWNVLRSGDNKRITEWVSQFGFWGPVFIVLAMVLQMFLLVINVVALILVAILAYGPVWGTILAVIAVMVASSVGYLIGHSVGEAGVSKIIGQKANKKVCAFMSNYGIWAIVIARISPFLSNDAVSFVAGFAKMTYWKFLAATFAGILPLTILLAWLGQDYDRLKIGLIWVSAISLVLFIGYVVYDKYFSKENKDATED